MKTTTESELAGSFAEMAEMARADGCDQVVVDDFYNIARWIAAGGMRVEFARRRLWAMRDAVTRMHEGALGAEVHIALAYEAFEKTYGPL